MKNLYWILPSAALAAAACLYLARDPWRLEQDRLADKLSTEIMAAPELEIYSLDPDHGGGPKGKAGVLPTNELFGRRTILGRSLITDPAERRELCDSIVDSLKRAKLLGPDCWEPRHAIRYSAKGGDKYLVVCFQCLHGFLDEPGSESKWFDVSSSSETAWDAVLLRHHLPKAK